MTAELVLSLVSRADGARGAIAAFAVTDQQVIAVGAAVLASALGDGLRFTARGAAVPVLHDALAVGDALWACGDGGWLAVSRDHGARWQPVATGTQARLRGLALGSDGAVWVVGDAGFAARVLGEAARRIELGTTADLGRVQAVRDEVVALGDDGRVVRWRDGATTSVACGATGPLCGLAITAKGTWIVVGHDGFVARSPDGAWYSRASAAGFEGDWRAIAQLADGSLVIAGERGQLMASSDDGRSWRVIDHALGVATLGAVARLGAGAVIGAADGTIATLGVAERTELRWEAIAEVPAVAQLVVPAASVVTPVEVPPEVLRAAELDATPIAQWSELAWQWIDDPDAHRALLARLDTADPAQHAQLGAIAALRFAGDDARAERVRTLGRALSPMVEAILAGVVVRGDSLAGALPSLDNHNDDALDDRSPGWAAIDHVLAPIYGHAEPKHYGSVVPYSLGGNDPIHGISAYPRSEPVPHWHFVTYGFTELFRKESDDADTSGYGFELTFRLVRDLSEEQPPMWAINFLQNLGRYVFKSGNSFAAGHKMGLNSPIALEHDTRITAICFADDPELGDIASPHGAARFVQVVGITDDEYRLIQEWSTPGLLEILSRHLPYLITDLERGSVLDDQAISDVIRERVDLEGSSEGLTFAGELQIATGAGQLRIEVGALYAVTLPRAMRGRIRHGRDYELRGHEATLRLEPSQAPSFHVDGDDVVLEVTPALAAEIEAALGDGFAGTYQFPSWDRLTIIVTPSVIRDQDGAATDVKGVRELGEVARLLEADRAQRADAAAAVAAAKDDASDEDEDEASDDDDDEDGDGDDEEVDDDDDDDATAELPDPARLAAALAMTTRALRLSPDDEDTQFTHGMLLIDAHRVGDATASAALLAALRGFAPAMRISVTVEMAKAKHAGFADAAEQVVAEPLPDQVFGGGMTSIGGGGIASFGNLAPELIEELAGAILDHAPRLSDRVVPRLPDDARLLSALAQRAVEAGERDAALALWDRMIAMATPPADEPGEVRKVYLRSFNNACIQAHATRAYDTAVRLADRVQPFAAENPHLFHAAACAYAAIHDYARAFDQVVLAIAHDYEHLAKIETDSDLGALLDWPDFQTAFRDWHARQEGN